MPAGGGEACTGSYACESDHFCFAGICTDATNSCTATDGTATGVTDMCDAGMSARGPFPALAVRLSHFDIVPGFCRDGGCASIPARQIGETCTSNNHCVGPQREYVYLPISCGGESGQQATCGGPSAYCLGMGGEATGPTDICFSGTCFECGDDLKTHSMLVISHFSLKDNVNSVNARQPHLSR